MTEKSTDAGAQPPTIDPCNVSEIFCDGPFVVTLNGGLSALTFTQIRIAPDPLFRCGENGFEEAAKSHAQYIVRTRLILPVKTMIDLRDVLNKLTKNAETPSHAVGGTKH